MIRVLMVEDNPADAELTRECLESCKLHMELTVVEDGESALRFLRREDPFTTVERPDLVLLDLNLPRLSGREVLVQMRQDDRFRLIPVVVLTSSDAETDIVRSYTAGANCYVTKPVGLKAFEAIVRSIAEFWFTVVRLP